ncbi:MAG: hypothetical protein KJ072_12715 [Verrucomicrobia bacterium]|nr:hypothetical protein [Verrucomicrobiota bacterium]
MFAAMAFLGASAVAGDRLIVCGAEEVFIIPADIAVAREADQSWRWTAADSPEIPETLHPRFRTTDECKPVGPYILITSSADGVALVRREDKRCVFHTTARNAHSACLLPGERVAVAASTGGDELLVFDQNRPGGEVTPLARLSLPGGHGVWWDAKSSRLWALGTQELLKVELIGAGPKTQLRVEARFALPTPGGHDLSPARDGKSLLVSSDTHVYVFDLATGRFSPYEPLRKSPGIKSVHEHLTLPAVVYHQATETTWWSDRIRFLAPERTIHLPNQRIYKVRWDN